MAVDYTAKYPIARPVPEATAEAWRTAQVIPIHKKGDPTVADNYHPISLTCTFPQDRGKVFAVCFGYTTSSFKAQRGALDQAFNLPHGDSKGIDVDRMIQTSATKGVTTHFRIYRTFILPVSEY